MNIQSIFRTVICCALGLASFAAAAQEALEEVTVTATRRAESIQDVPVSVVAFGAETINDLGVINVADISAYVPNMEFVSNGVRSNFYMRGIGSGPTHSIEQSVGRFVDDVYIGRADANLHGFLDLAGIEVLRGPQGTLFGKNTAAGAVIVRTADPTNEFTAGVKAKYGEYSTVNGYQDVEGFVSGPLSDTVRARFAMRFRDDGGFVENILSGPDSADRQDLLTRLKLEWDVGANTTVGFKAEYATFDMDGQAIGEVNGVPSAFPLSGPPLEAVSPDLLEVDWVNGIDCESETVYTTPPPGTPLPSPPFPPIAVFEDITGLPGGTTVNSGTFCPGREQDTSTVALTIDRELESGGTLRFITALQNYDWDHRFNSIDQGAGTTFRAIRAEDYEGLSAEIRFTSEARENFDYIAGLYYESSDLERFQRSHFNFTSFFGAPLPFLTRNEPWNQETDTIAAYGQFRWSFSDTLSATVGARFSDESKDYKFDRFCNPYQTNDPFAPNGLFGGQCPAFFNFDADRLESRSEDDFSPSFGLEWQASDDVMVFFNASQGYKSGGFSDRVESQTGRIDYDPESNTTLELGFKGTFLDGAMNANVTLFHMDIEDMQLASATSSLGFEVTNAGQATSQGAELEVDWQLTDILRVGGNLGLTNAEFDEFNGACQASAADSPRYGVAPANTDGSGTCDFSGFPLIFAPEYKGAVYGLFEVPDAAAGWDLTARLTASFSDEFATSQTLEAGEFQESFTKWDATLRLSSPDGRYSWALVGRNLTEEATLDWSILQGNPFVRMYFASAKPPRDISLQFQANW